MAILAFGPESQVEICPVVGGLHPQPGEWRLGGRSLPGCTDGREKVRSFLVAQVLADDRVVEHGGPARCGLGQHPPSPGGGGLALKCNLLFARDRQGTPHAGDPLDLIGPNVGEQGEAARGCDRVNW